MKTYTEFSRDLNEFKVGNFMKKYQPLKSVTRVFNVKDMVSKNKSIGDRISSGIGVVKPYDIGGMLMKPIFDQGKKDSFVNKGVNFLAKQNNKVSFLPKAGADEKTDIGKRLSDQIGKIIKTKPTIGSRSRFK
tara:strand:+ start:114 stop:512 length:399 start_codon:yes stop_codon:yes gene_type:complete